MADPAAPADTAAMQAQARLHHDWLMGLQLMLVREAGPAAAGDWSWRLFRRQHEAKFLASLDKLGLRGLPDAVACARYHVLSNAIGGVAVEYAEEGPAKAWVRFRYPRWMYSGPVICGIPREVSRGFLRGWYAHNGVSLGNPRLGFVCVSEDMDGPDDDAADAAAAQPFGLCGYFLEHDRPLSEAERLRFAPGERPPPFDPAAQPRPPAETWTPERLARAERNYAVEYIRNGLLALAEVLGPERADRLARRSARLIGLQGYAASAAAVGARDGDAADGLAYLARMFSGMDDAVEWLAPSGPGEGPALRHGGLRIARGLAGAERERMLAAWFALWAGALAATRAVLEVQVEPIGDDAWRWRVRP